MPSSNSNSNPTSNLNTNQSPHSNPTPTPATELTPEALLARHSIALARSQRLVDSWLPVAATPSNPSDSTHEHEHEQDLPAELEDGRPSMLGLGAVASAKSGIRKSNGELERLREQLVGRRGGGFGVARAVSGKGTLKGQGGAAAAAVAVRAVNRGAEDSENEEVGRAGMFLSKVEKRKRKREGDGDGAAVALKEEMASENVESGDEPAQSGGIAAKGALVKVTNRSKRQNATFLDEVLAERARKGGKKKRKKHRDKESNKSNT